MNEINEEIFTLPEESPLKLDPSVSVIPDPNGVGVFLQFTTPAPTDRAILPVGQLEGITRFTCCHRYEPFWMTSMAGTSLSEVPVETQYLLAEFDNGDVALFVPLIDGAFRASLQGSEAGLDLVAETGDAAVTQATGTLLFVAMGENPYDVIAQAAESVAAHLKTCRLRKDKPLPEFANLFGWCTWDAFYQDVSEEKVRLGLDSFVEGAVPPRYLILDDGWQSVKKQETGEVCLTAFAANEKFPGDLKATVAMAKEEFGIETFLVWHAFNGYWGGVDNEALPQYRVTINPRSYSPGILHHVPNMNTYWDGRIGTVHGEDIYRFYQDYHRYLRQQGVDGVKVDSQASLEGVAQGLGGRVALMQQYREALEGSVAVHFEGNLINCMSLANEMLYGTLASTLTRTSTDFWPNKPESHGAHLYVNAQVSAWFGEFVHPDWDMFQSGHQMGMYHAAGRAVGGCPVYVSDKPDIHNFDVLRKLVLPDGNVLRGDQPGRPTRDCLFHDPTKEDVLLKIFNVNRDIRSGEISSGVVGVFHAKYSPEGTKPISGSVSPSDVDGLTESSNPFAEVMNEMFGQLGAEIPQTQYAVWSHHAQELQVLSETERLEVTLQPLTAEVFTIVPISEDGIAPIGLVDKFNSGGAIVTQEGDEETRQFYLVSPGTFVAYCAQEPADVLVMENNVTYDYNADTGCLKVVMDENADLVPASGAVIVTIVF